MIIVFLGAPGSGKGSQAQYLEESFAFKHLSTGEMLRSEIAQKTKLGQEIEQLIGQGNLIDDKLITSLVKGQLVDSANQNIILDGYPRTVQQCLDLQDLLKVNNIQLCSVIDFQVDFNHLLERIEGRLTCKSCQAVFHERFSPPATEGVCDQCGGELIRRKDDTVTLLKKRFDIYMKELVPIKEFYEKIGLYKPIDASQSIKDINKELENCLAQCGLIIEGE